MQASSLPIRSLVILALGALLAVLAPRAFAAGKPAPKPFPGNVGVQLYSLRGDLKRDVPGTLTKVKAMGFDFVEVPELYGLSAEAFRKALDDAGLDARGLMAPFERLRDDVASVIADAKTLGVEYVLCAWVPHQNQVYTAEDNANAIAVFNAAGAAIKKAGLRFAYHVHGYELLAQIAPGKTLFDDMVAKSKKGVVDFEMDVFWFRFAGVDPVGYLRKYPGRFPLLHLKDMRQGTAVGLHPKKADTEAQVVLGTGMVDIAAVVREAKKQRARFFFLEDESRGAASQLPQSLSYVRTLK